MNNNQIITKFIDGLTISACCERNEEKQSAKFNILDRLIDLGYGVFPKSLGSDNSGMEGICFD